MPRNVIGGNDGNHHCKACADEDNTRMVQCDRCDDWYHFECVEVSQGVAHRDWQCSKCLSVSKGGRKKASTKEPSSDPAVSTSVQTNPSIRVTSVPLNVVPQIPTTLPVFPNVTSGDVNESAISHVPSNMMFPPMSTHSPNPSNAHVTISTCTASMLIPPSIFTLATFAPYVRIIESIKPTGCLCCSKCLSWNGGYKTMPSHIFRPSSYQHPLSIQYHHSNYRSFS